MGRIKLIGIKKAPGAGFAQAGSATLHNSVILTILSLAFLFFEAHATADVTADSSGTPLLEVFQLIKTGPDTFYNGPTGRPTHHWKTDDKHPLVVVKSLSDFLLEDDKKNVRVILNKKDAPLVADAFHKYGVLGITSGDTATIMMSSRPFDGSLYFTDPVAGNLRKRFHIKAGTNVMEPSH